MSYIPLINRDQVTDFGEIYSKDITTA